MTSSRFNAPLNMISSISQPGQSYYQLPANLMIPSNVFTGQSNFSASPSFYNPFFQNFPSSNMQNMMSFRSNYHHPM